VAAGLPSLGRVHTRRLGVVPSGVRRTGFPALLLDASLISRDDLSLAEQHPVREPMELADAVVALALGRRARR
jgi:hypothetical protein